MRVVVLCLDVVAVLLFLCGALGYRHYRKEINDYYEAVECTRILHGTVVNVLKDNTFVYWDISCKEVFEGRVFKTSLYPKSFENSFKVGDEVSVRFFGDGEIGTFLIDSRPFSESEALLGMFRYITVRCRRVTFLALAFAVLAFVLSLLV